MASCRDAAAQRARVARARHSRPRGPQLQLATHRPALIPHRSSNRNTSLRHSSARRQFEQRTASKPADGRVLILTTLEIAAVPHASCYRLPRADGWTTSVLREYHPAEFFKRLRLET